MPHPGGELLYHVYVEIHAACQRAAVAAGWAETPGVARRPNAAPARRRAKATTVRAGRFLGMGDTPAGCAVPPSAATLARRPATSLAQCQAGAPAANQPTAARARSASRARRRPAARRVRCG